MEPVLIEIILNLVLSILLWAIYLFYALIIDGRNCEKAVRFKHIWYIFSAVTLIWAIGKIANGVHNYIFN